MAYLYSNLAVFVSSIPIFICAVYLNSQLNCFAFYLACLLIICLSSLALPISVIYFIGRRGNSFLNTKLRIHLISKSFTLVLFVIILIIFSASKNSILDEQYTLIDYGTTFALQRAEADARVTSTALALFFFSMPLVSFRSYMVM